MAFTWLRRNRQALTDHGVTVDRQRDHSSPLHDFTYRSTTLMCLSFHPIFLGGINAGSGNKPPWTLPAKAAYGKFDLARGSKYFNVPAMVTPPFMPILSLLPSRCLLFVKDTYPAPKFEDAFYELWISMWQRHEDISQPEMMAKCLSRHFDDQHVRRILEAGAHPHYKKLLTDETAKLVAKGAFGAPWFFVTDRHGREENFFGSDRFHFMLQYLEVPFSDIRIEPPSASVKL